MAEHKTTGHQPVAPRWAGRVPRRKIARFYELDARGIADEDLIDDVAYSLLARCESMLAAEAAHRGHATCPVCSGIVEHEWDKQAELLCGNCGWKGRWLEYWKSYKGKHLGAGGLTPFCKEFIRRFPSARTPSDKMLLVDWLIHRFHWEGKAGVLGRPGAVNLIGGSAREVNDFLRALTFGDSSHPQIREQHEAWLTSRHERQEAWDAELAEKLRAVEKKRRRKAGKDRRRNDRKDTGNTFKE